MADDRPKARIIDSIEEHSKSTGFGVGHEHTFYFTYVRKGKDEAKVEIENPLYTIEVDRSKGTRLGLKLDMQVSSRSLFIKEVVGGLAFTWNTQHPDAKVRPGDRILRVNKVEGDAHALMEECKKTSVLELELHRQTAVPITAGLHVRTKTDSVNGLPEGATGVVAKVDEDGDALMKFDDYPPRWVAKQDYDQYIFEDTDRYYLRRYCDFRDLYNSLKAKADSDPQAPIKVLPEIPAEERFGFRRQLSSLGVSSFMKARQDGLQKVLDTVFAQLPTLETEPLVAEFFGSNQLPEVATTAKDVLKQRMDILIARERQKAEGK